MFIQNIINISNMFSKAIDAPMKGQLNSANKSKIEFAKINIFANLNICIFLENNNIPKIILRGFAQIIL